MGCDIHAFVDYVDEIGAHNFARVHIGRDYGLFGLLTGTRTDPNQTSLGLLVSPRGLPDKVSYDVEEEYTIVVSDELNNADHPNTCTQEQAEKWLARGMSEWWDERRKRITNPDWHTASYLYLDELKLIQDLYRDMGDNRNRLVDKSNYSNQDLAAIIAMMESLDSKQPKRSRLVFWYDN